MGPVIQILKAIFSRRWSRYYFLSRSLFLLSAPLLSSPWWVPLLKPIVSTFFSIKIETDLTFYIGLLTFMLAILTGLLAYFKEIQKPYDQNKFHELFAIITEIRFYEIFNFLNINARILKEDRVTIEMLNAFLKLEINKFKHPWLNYKTNQLLKSINKFDTFFFPNAFDLRGQNTPYFYIRPDWNIDLTEGVAIDKQLQFDKKLSELDKIVQELKYRFRLLMKAKRRVI